MINIKIQQMKVLLVEGKRKITPRKMALSRATRNGELKKASHVTAAEDQTTHPRCVVFATTIAIIATRRVTWRRYVEKKPRKVNMRRMK